VGIVIIVFFVILLFVEVTDEPDAGRNVFFLVRKPNTGSWDDESPGWLEVSTHERQGSFVRNTTTSFPHTN
jgi:hypothetical protein